MLHTDVFNSVIRLVTLLSINSLNYRSSVHYALNSTAENDEHATQENFKSHGAILISVLLEIMSFCHF